MNVLKMLSILSLVSLTNSAYARNAESEDKQADFDATAIGTAIDEARLYKFDKMEGLHDKKASEALSALSSISELKSKRKSYTGDFTKLSDAEHKYFVVAQVNSEVITNIDIINAIKFIFFSAGRKYNKDEAKLMIKAVISSMIDSRLQQQYAAFCKIKIQDSEIDAKVRDLAEKNNMTLDEMKKQFEEIGINMDLFKKNIRARMILSIIVDMLSEDIKVSEQDIIEEQAKIATDIKNARYHLNEIFFRVDDPKTKKSVKEQADATLKLIETGFNFPVLSENLSQGNYTGTIGDLGWVREENLDQKVRDAVKSLAPGSHSGVIETRTGYKIIYVVDKADPKKVGQSLAVYKILKSKLQYRGGFMTQQDEQKTNEAAGVLSASDSAEKFKQNCKKYDLEFEEKDLEAPTFAELEVLNKSKQTGKPVIFQSPDDENSVEIVFVCDEKIPDAKIPSNEETTDIVAARKVEKEFNKNLRKMRNTAHIVTFNDKLDKVL